MLLVFCTADHGGLADYAHAQAEALAARGHQVLLLVPPQFPDRAASYQRQNLPSPAHRIRRFRWLQRFATATAIFTQQWALTRAIAATGACCVLFTSYSEYLAPLWAWRLRRWSRCGVRFAAVIHDPVRDYVVGPRWWHRLSIAQGYSFLDVAFVHSPIHLDTGLVRSKLSTVVIPHGPFPYPASPSSQIDLRSRLRVPNQVYLLLSFGHIRDNKNLHLVLQALQHHPSVWLLVAGPEATAGQRSSTQYQHLAEELGVADRCLWSVGYQDSGQVAEHFTIADAVLLTYSASFRSASGVMHLAAHYRKPVLASAGESALLDAVRDFRLGVVVPPDAAHTISDGIDALINRPCTPDWQEYEQLNSWERNARLVSQALGLEPTRKALIS